MQKQTTLTCPDNAAAVIEVGFVPTKFTATNRTTLITLEWNENLPAGYFYKIVAAGDRTLVTSGGPTLIDGSDKSANLTSSFGVIIPVIADIQDTAAEVLDIEFIKDDNV
jgi:hypothetical protein